MCNHTAADSCNHTLLQSDHSPRGSNSQCMAAAGTGCTGHSCFCNLRSTAMICLSVDSAAAAVGSLNSQRSKRHTDELHQVILLVLQAQTNPLA